MKQITEQKINKELEKKIRKRIEKCKHFSGEISIIHDDLELIFNKEKEYNFVSSSTIEDIKKMGFYLISVGNEEIYFLKKGGNDEK